MQENFHFFCSIGSTFYQSSIHKIYKYYQDLVTLKGEVFIFDLEIVIIKLWSMLKRCLCSADPNKTHYEQLHTRVIS